jgi:hypothetical protein
VPAVGLPVAAGVLSSLQVEHAAAVPAAEELVAKDELRHAGLHAEELSAAAAVPTGEGSKNWSARKRRQKTREDGEAALHLADGEARSCRWEPPPAWRSNLKEQLAGHFPGLEATKVLASLDRVDIELERSTCLQPGGASAIRARILVALSCRCGAR